MIESIDLTMLLLVAALIVVVVWGGFVWHNRKRVQLLKAPLPKEWEQIIQHNVSLARMVPEQLRPRWHGLINLFLAEKDFEGCGGLAISDEIRVTIAALATLLLLNRDTDYFPSLNSILVYPGAFIVRGGPTAPGIYDEQADVRLGESWMRGAVVLAWDQIVYDSRRQRSGNNVVLHEFAHQLDQQNGFSEDQPAFSDPAEADRFARLIAREFVQLRDESTSGIHDVIDDYGAVNPAEFFAVATEAFFTMPESLRRSHRELYDGLGAFYRLDPANWKRQGNETVAAA